MFLMLQCDNEQNTAALGIHSFKNSRIKH